jgi:type VI secretion system protein VasG
LTRTLLPEMSGEFLARMGAGQSIASVNVGVGNGGQFEYAVV